MAASLPKFRENETQRTAMRPASRGCAGGSAGICLTTSRVRSLEPSSTKISSNRRFSSTLSMSSSRVDVTSS